MLPTFVIGLREGVEAALIVGIIAAFLRQEQRGDALRYVWAGVGIAIVLCAAVGVALQIVDQDLPQRQQEGLETIVGLAAVGMVTFMIVWMRRNARGLRKELERKRRWRAGARLDLRARRHGLLRRAARGPRDRRLPARGVPVRRPTRPRRASVRCSASRSRS